MKNKHNITRIRYISEARAKLATAIIIAVPIAWVIVLITFAVLYGTGKD